MATVEPIAKPVIVPISEPILQKVSVPEIKEKKETEFQIKFRNPDPKGLNVFKKTETVQTTQKNNFVLAKTDNEIQIRDNNTTAKKPGVFVDRTKLPLSNKEIIQAVVSDDKSVQNKFSSPDIKNPDLQIKNDDPLIVIEDPRPVMVRDDAVIKNRLIPNSSINLKELLNKDESKLKVKENESIGVKDEKEIQSKPASVFIDKANIKSDINESTKETKIFNPFLDNKNGNSQNKSNETVTSQSDIKIKTNEPSKELRKILSFVEKDDKVIQPKPVVPVVEKPDIKFRTNETPKELRRDNPFLRKVVKEPETNPVAPAIDKPDIKIRTNDLPKEVKTGSPVVQKLDLNIKNKSKANPDSSETLNSKVEIKPVIAKDDSSLQKIKPSIDQTSLKIRETSFVENDKDATISKQEVKIPVTAAKTNKENIIDVHSARESINTNKVSTKLEDTKPDILIENPSYETEVKTHKKKSTRKILTAAALFAVIVVSGVFIYLKPQDTLVKAAGEIKYSNKSVVNEQANLGLQNDLAAANTTNEVKETVENSALELKKNEAKVSLPPLPETLTKKESTYYTLNEKNDLVSTTIKENNQTAAAKTENIIPPKEEKKIEEEPTFFLAVEEMPELIGGIKGLQNRIVYPEIAKQTGTEGKVIVQAVVDEKGNIISAKTIKGIGAGCDEVALDAVLNSKFKPGKQRGKNVKVQISVPIVFKK